MIIFQNFLEKMEEGKGFEPSIRYERIHAFQACALNHSATPPFNEITNERFQRVRNLLNHTPDRKLFCKKLSCFYLCMICGYLELVLADITTLWL